MNQFSVSKESAMRQVPLIRRYPGNNLCYAACTTDGKISPLAGHQCLCRQARDRSWLQFLGPGPGLMDCRPSDSDSTPPLPCQGVTSGLGCEVVPESFWKTFSSPVHNFDCICRLSYVAESVEYVIKLLRAEFENFSSDQCDT